MPRMDGMGPMGRGPMTGRGMGQCSCAVSRMQGGKWQSLTREEKFDLLKKDKEAIESEIASLEQSK
jgi:hypothetical protein